MLKLNAKTLDNKVKKKKMKKKIVEKHLMCNATRISQGLLFSFSKA